MKPAPGSSKIVPLMAKAEPISDGGSISGITYSRREDVTVQDSNSADPRLVKKEGEDRDSPSSPGWRSCPPAARGDPWWMEQISTCSPCGRPMPEQVDAQEILIL